MERRSDADLMRASRMDSRAFGELYDRHAFAIHSWFRRRVGEPAATDLTSETFASAWTSRQGARPRLWETGSVDHSGRIAGLKATTFLSMARSRQVVTSGEPASLIREGDSRRGCRGFCPS